MPPKEKTIIPPEGGWKPKTYYAVHVAVEHSNPVWGAIFYSGFLDDTEPNQPGGYASVWTGGSDRIPYSRLHYLKTLHPLDVPHGFIQPEVGQLPEEVQQLIKWNFEKAASVPDEFHCVPKSDMDRGEAWELIRPVGTPGERFTKEDNPWRKLHSEHYWVWYVKKGEEEA